MVKINRVLISSLMLATLAGCRSGQSVTDSIVSWRPFSKKSDQLIPVEPETESLVEKTVAEKTVAEETVAEETEAEVGQVSLEKIVGSFSSDLEQPKTGEVAQPVETPTVDLEMASFEDFQKSLQKKELEASQLTAKVEQSIEQKSSKAKLLIQNQQSTKVATTQIDDAFIDTAKLTTEIDSILAEKELEASETVETAQEQKKASVEQSVQTSKNDAADIAFDLTAFADAAVVDVSALEQKQEKAEPVAKTIAKTTKSKSEEKSQLVTSLNNKKQELFPWAIQQSGLNASSKKITASIIENVSIEKVETEVDKKKVKRPRKIQISQAILQNLERALGNENWRAAGRARINSLASNMQPQNKQLGQISELLYSKNPKLRIKGLQLAADTGEASPEVCEMVRPLLDDEDPLVQVHSASVLAHWNRSTDKVISTLSTVLASQNANARQFAAMRLGEMPEQKDRVLPLLESHLLNSTGLPALHITEAILKLQPMHVDAVSRMAELLRDKNVEVRWLAAHALGSVQGELQPFAVEALRGGLRDVDSQVRATSALSLGGFGSASQVVLTELVFLTEHGDSNVKDAAKIALDCID